MKFTRNMMHPYIFAGRQEKEIKPFRNRLSNLNVLILKISEITGISIEDLKSSSRKGEVVTARNAFMFAAVVKYNLTTASAGSFVNRDHATVLHACKRCDSCKPYDVQQYNVMKALELDRYIGQYERMKKIKMY